MNLPKIAGDIVAFFSIIFNGVAAFVRGVLKALWWPFGVVLAFLWRIIKAIAHGIAVAARAVWRAIVATWKAITGFFKDKSPAAAVLFAAGWVTLIVCCGILYTWDANFYSRQASPVLPVISYMGVGVVFRTIAIIGLPFLIRSFTRKEWGGAFAWLIVWLISIPACVLAAFGAVTEGQDYHFRNASAIVQTADVSVGSFDEQIRRVEGEKAKERQALDALIAGARTSMKDVTTDGDGDNDDLPAFETSIRQFTVDSTTRQAAFDEQIKTLEAAKLTAKTTSTSDAVNEPPIAAVYQFPSRYVPQVQPMVFRDGAAVYWVVGLEIIGFLLPGTLYAAHLVASHRIPVQKQPKIKLQKPRRRLKWRLWEKAAGFLFEPAPPPDPSTLAPTAAQQMKDAAEQAEKDMAAALEIEAINQRTEELRRKLREMQNKPADPPPLTAAQLAAQNAGNKAPHAAAAAALVIRIPVGAWGSRIDRQTKQAANGN